MTLPLRQTDPLLYIIQVLREYPVLCDRIREEMRAQLFLAGVISLDDFEEIVREQAIHTQQREGLEDPFGQEAPELWDKRIHIVRENLTEFYFANNLGIEMFSVLVDRILARQPHEEPPTTLDPEKQNIQAWIKKIKDIEDMPEADRTSEHQAALESIKVKVILDIISEESEYVTIARKWFTGRDLEEIENKKIGYGKVGGKSAGMLLADCILRAAGGSDIAGSIRQPESWFLGSNLMYDFMWRNGLMKWNNQKFKTAEVIDEQYPIILREYLNGKFPTELLRQLRVMIEQLHGKPLIVRSSSLLEDNFGSVFAGKYESHFCPNQGTPEQNLFDLTQAIARIYASTLHHEPLLYRLSKGLQVFDEQMAILIQVVEGKTYGHYFFPDAAGVGFSRNLYRWSPRIQRDNGFVRLVWGLGTRAVDNTNETLRPVALSHPMLRPAATTKDIQRFSQQYIDLIDLSKNELVSLPVKEVLGANYPALRFVGQLDKEGFLAPIRSNLTAEQMEHVYITFDEFLRRTPFAGRMRKMLQLLEAEYTAPVDMEFVVHIENALSGNASIYLSILQCRPQSHVKDSEAHLPEGLHEQDILFSTRHMVPRGQVKNIEYVIYVPAVHYFTLPTEAGRLALARAISLLNKALKGRTFICIGPGRWGTSNPELGVKVGYTDIFNARALIELTGMGIGPPLEPSFGTHFFQDLMEANSYPLAINLEDGDVMFKQDFFDHASNSLSGFLPPEYLQQHPFLEQSLRLIHIPQVHPGRRLDLIMDDQKPRAVCFLTTPKPDEED